MTARRAGERERQRRKGAGGEREDRGGGGAVREREREIRCQRGGGGGGREEREKISAFRCQKLAALAIMFSVLHLGQAGSSAMTPRGQVICSEEQQGHSKGRHRSVVPANEDRKWSAVIT